MCKVQQMLRALLNQRLSAAVEEVVGVFERTIAEYEEQLCRTKEENERQRQLLDAVFKTQGGHKRDVSEDDPVKQEWRSGVEQQDLAHPHIKKEKVEEQEWRSGVEQQDPARPNIKEEEVEEQLQRPELLEDHVIKIENCQSEENRGTEPPSSNSGRHVTTQGDGDHCGGPQADGRFAPLSVSDGMTSHLPDIDNKQWKVDVRCHTDDRCWKCSQCDKVFFNQTHLNRHMGWHTGERPFMCSDCGQAFFKEPHLTTHRRTHTGEKPFSCSVCSKSFSVRFGLTQHMRTHNQEKPFRCSVCDKRFAYPVSLMRHASTHTGENTHSCSVCHASFRLRSSLMIHMRIHTGEKLFSCPVCKKTFCAGTCL
ncbi:zinc finger protein 37 homolog [Hippocampus comes]|uniref:Zinc finger protein 37 homolog n=1 Tax=Hippocampus comes TaxID=109280 RepID=A0A3Q3E9R9_HIPCM|nr:PREDICTED: zinc finger protein 37 homolog [Hippocampus comes]